MKYWPNPAHKRETSEAGPPRWHPNKSACPPMTVEERQKLFLESVPEDGDQPASPRYAFRVGPRGYEWFAARLTRVSPEGETEFHGYPTDHVPPRVLRRFRDLQRLSDAEYRRLLKEVG